MQSRILDSSYVIDFIGSGFDSQVICSKIKLEADKIVESIKDEKLKDWEVHFIFRYNNVKQILIYTQGRSYPKEKYKEITIHIPIPTIDIISWGVTKDQHIYDSNHLDKKIKNFDCLEVVFSKYENREDYIMDCMRRAIKFSFDNGFTINGIKLKNNLK
jgi:hypothetical protein